MAAHLGLLRTALFHQRAPLPAPSPPEGQVIRVNPPAVLLRGEVREDTPSCVTCSALSSLAPCPIMSW